MAQDYFKNRYYVKFQLTGSEKERYWKIKEREPIRYDTSQGSEFSSIASGASSGDIEIPNLEPAENELYYIIPSFKDGCEYRVRIPSGTDRFGIAKKTDSGILRNRDSPYFLPNPQWGFFVAIKTRFQVNATNNTPEAVTPQVYFEGMKYRVEEVTDEDTIKKLESGTIKSTEIQLGGFSR